MKKIDFSKIVIKDIDGKPYIDRRITPKGEEAVPYDFAKTLGNALFYTSQDIRLSELGQKIYHHEVIEVTDEELQSIREAINKGFVAFVLLSANPQIDEMLK